ncbi:SDR family NAD(P)-dependent oxidoreductase [Alkalihalobacillus trypoxylicola]|uniref:Short-chain dehydrogenase n=1 Tax=Alkalihalobacillus trypoxylicola TaxID=519424 RepID=A0A161P4Z1_9BACI|nr:glucose 1-dehydrogenase [Alkalihalobacillus trypoxylicola]KYG26995.1 short-chain dehydrogenase [Alkalihalobacillus trypoxylicola]
MRLKDKVILITGAGSGIGKCSAKRFAEEGAIVIVNDLNKEAGETTINEIREIHQQAWFVQADVTNPLQVQEMIESVVSKHGRIDVLFNNAGISGVGKLHELNVKDWNRTLDVNINGVMLPCKYALPFMMRQRNGVIINMSSCIAEIGLASRASYATSKGAILSLTKSLQVDYAAYNIRINAILPGTIMTPFVEEYLKTSYDDPDLAINKIKSRQLSGELGKPEDIAHAALFLASDESKFMMGSPLYIDGGVVFGKDA